MKRLALLLLVASLLGACEEDAPSPQTREAKSPGLETRSSEDAGPEAKRETAADAYVAALNRSIAFQRGRIEKDPKNWLGHNAIANALLSRGRVTSDDADVGRAEAALEAALAIVGTPPAELLITRARMAQSGHKIAAAEADLDAAAKQRMRSVGALVAGQILRGVIQAERGEFDAALASWDASLETSPSPTTYALKARTLGHLEDKEAETEAAWTEALKRAEKDAYTGAWVNVHRGLAELERGRYRTALDYYEEAARLFDGWFFVEEHAAEAAALLGDIDRAVVLMEGVVRQAPHPEFVDALADLLEQQGGHDARVATLRAESLEAFKGEVEADPIGAAGHAVDFYLKRDPAEAARLGAIDLEARPGPEPRVRLAHAQLAAGLAAEACATLAPIWATPWRSARALAVGATCAEQSGDTETAAARRAAAIERNPSAFAEFFGER